MPTSQCPQYLSDNERLKSLSRDSSEFTSLLSDLRKLICDKRKKKVCCEQSNTRASNRNEVIYVSSTGNAADYQGGALGLYKLLSRRHNNAPVYKQFHTGTDGTQIFMYRDDHGYWMASEKLGANGSPDSGYLCNTIKSSRPPRSGWQYSNNGWPTDHLMSAVSVTNMTELICPVITISATVRATRKLPFYLGQYRVSGQYSCGKPVYTNSYNKYLSVSPGNVDWTVADDMDMSDAVIRSGSAPGLCPASARSSYNKRRGQTSWQWWDGDQWRQGEISLSCDDNNGSCSI